MSTWLTYYKFKEAQHNAENALLKMLEAGFTDSIDEGHVERFEQNIRALAESRAEAFDAHVEELLDAARAALLTKAVSP